jgi:hypothetical protein
VVAWALQNGYSYPPGSNATITPITGGGQGPTVNILDPQDSQTISLMPFTVSVNAFSSSPIARIDLSVDGQYYQSVTSQPFFFTVNKSLNDGSHVLAAHAVDSAGQTADTSVNIMLDITSPLTLTQPPDQSLLQFPATLNAETNKLYNTVNFYYQTSSGQNVLIGPAQNTSHTSNVYDYSLTWQTPPDSGSYLIYAKTDTGIATKKIRVTIP